MKIGIIGGSFDPPHIGHALVAIQVKEIIEMDEVWLMPCFVHPFGKNLSSSENRFRMTKYLENKHIKVSDLEIKKAQISYTIDTLTLLKSTYPRDEFYWIISSGDLKDFKKWKNYIEIIEKYNLIVFPRGTNDLNLEKEIKDALSLMSIPKNIVIVKSENLITTNISSTAIRERVKNNLNIEHMVPPKVQSFILDHNLYN